MDGRDQEIDAKSFARIILVALVAEVFSSTPVAIRKLDTLNERPIVLDRCLHDSLPEAVAARLGSCRQL